MRSILCALALLLTPALVQADQQVFSNWSTVGPAATHRVATVEDCLMFRDQECLIYRNGSTDMLIPGGVEGQELTISSGSVSSLTPHVEAEIVLGDALECVRAGHTWVVEPSGIKWCEDPRRPMHDSRLVRECLYYGYVVKVWREADRVRMTCRTPAYFNR